MKILHSTFYILLSVILLAFLFTLSSPIAFAAESDILPPDIIKPVGDNAATQKALPTSDFRFEIIPKVIKLTLALVGTVSVAVFVYAGVMLIIAQGNEEDIKKFKEILIWSIVGLLFITLSYAIVTGVMNLVFT